LNEPLNSILRCAAPLEGFIIFLWLLLIFRRSAAFSKNHRFSVGTTNRCSAPKH